MIVDYDDLLDVLDGGQLPVVAVIPCEDHDGHVLYWDTHFTRHPVTGDLEDAAKQRGISAGSLTGAVAAYAIRLGHKEYTDAGS